MWGEGVCDGLSGEKGQWLNFWGDGGGGWSWGVETNMEEITDGISLDHAAELWGRDSFEVTLGKGDGNQVHCHSRQGRAEEVWVALVDPGGGPGGFARSWSLSAIRTKKREAQRCPHVNFSSQLKQSPCSRRLAISAGVRRFSGTGGGFGGVGNKGSGEGAGEGGERGKVGGGCDYDGVGRYSADKA
ncbi:hypothetical protein GYH30_021720 [Glycine max]|nr:hypothetical protein GYH30_021720 [Glycine max]